MTDENGLDPNLEFKTVDKWMATVPWITRGKYSIIMLSDWAVDGFNHLQDAIRGTHNRSLSRLLAVVAFIIVLVVIAKVLCG